MSMTVAGVRALGKALRLNMSSDAELPRDMQRALLRLAARDLVSVQRVSPCPTLTRRSMPMKKISKPEKKLVPPPERPTEVQPPRQQQVLPVPHRMSA